MSVRVFRRFGFLDLFHLHPRKTVLFAILGASQPRKRRYLRYLVPPSIENTAIYNTRCLPDSKAPLFTTLGASWPHYHRFGRARCPPHAQSRCSRPARHRLQDRNPGSRFGRHRFLLEIPACVNECKSLPHFAAFLFAPVRSKSLPLACWALPEKTNLLFQVCSAPPFHLKFLSV